MGLVLISLIPSVLRADFQKAGLKSAIVEYTYESKGMGSTVTGTKTTWLSDYGRVQATRKKEKTVTRIFGIGKTEETETLSIMKGDYAYEIDLKTKTGTRVKVKVMKDFASAYTREVEAQGKSMEEVRDEWVKQYNGRWIGNETVLGRDCKGLEIFGIKQWLYEQLTLKSEGSLMGIKTKETATSLKENVSIPSSVFEVPEGISMTDAPDISELINGEQAGKSVAKGNAEEGGGLAALLQIAAAMEQADQQAGADRQGQVEEEEAQQPKVKHNRRHRSDDNEDEQDETEDDRADHPCGISFKDFKRMVSHVTIKGMDSPKLETEDGTHVALYMKSLLNSAQIIGGGYISRDEYLAEAKKESEGDSFILKKVEFRRNGRDALYYELGGNGSKALASNIIVFDPKKQATIIVNVMPARSRDELEDILDDLGY